MFLHIQLFKTSYILEHPHNKCDLQLNVAIENY